MKCTRWMGPLTAWSAVLGLMVPGQVWAQLPQSEAVASRVAPGPASALSVAPQVVDIALTDEGTLLGQAVASSGAPMAASPVTIDDGSFRLQLQTDSSGQFHAALPRGGVYRVQVGNQVQVCRVWKAGTAPPSTLPGLLLVQGDPLVLGQYSAPPLGAGFAGAKGALANPLVFGGIVAAAIAIPVAIHNAGDDPAS